MIWVGLWLLLGYLSGSVSFAYLGGRLLRGIDVRKYGSHAATGSTFWDHVSKPGAIAVGLLDTGKAALPTWLALQTGFELSVALLAGLGAVVGHCWPFYLRFRGGRGIATCGGTLFPTFIPGIFWLAFFIGVGRLVGQPALFSLAGFLTLPALVLAAGWPLSVFWACVAMIGLIVLKRLEANREPLPRGPKRWTVLFRRALLDRDLVDWGAWLRRKPEERDAASPHDEGASADSPLD